MKTSVKHIAQMLLGSTASAEDSQRAGFRSFEAEADEVMSRAKTQRAQTLVRSAVVVVLVLIVWAALAHVDEVTRGEGKVIPSRQLQLVQSFEAAWSRRSWSRKARWSRRTSCC